MRILIINSHDQLIFTGDAGDLIFWLLNAKNPSDYLYIVRTQDYSAIYSYAEIAKLIVEMVKKVKV